MQMPMQLNGTRMTAAIGIGMESAINLCLTKRVRIRLQNYDTAYWTIHYGECGETAKRTGARVGDDHVRREEQVDSSSVSHVDRISEQFEIRNA